MDDHENNKLIPLTTETPHLPSFSSLRARNLSTLYSKNNDDTDKSPKGSIDVKIEPLCNLINTHVEYVTTSSCSGRVALFDPGVVAEGNDDDDDDETKTKSTALSGKGRGRWRFVSHDTLDDLGTQLVHALEEAIQELQEVNARHTGGTRCHSKMLTLKYEPPLLHIAAASLSAGQQLLKVFKSTCRESGLVHTDQRVTVEVRSMGTALCIPIIVTANDGDNGGDESTFRYSPPKEYIMDLAEVMNERMVQKDELLDRLYDTVKKDLFIEKCSDMQCRHFDEYEMELHPLPSLNLWKTAAVALTSNGTNHSPSIDEPIDDDVHVLAFGGQGIGPNGGSTCQRWDCIFCLKRKKGIWSDSWEQVKILDSNEVIFGKVHDNNSGLIKTAAGTYQVEIVKSFGRREGHSTCILPSMMCNSSLPDVTIIFGGRTGGPLSPTNDFFFFILQSNMQEEDGTFGMLCKPSDIRGSPPSGRFGHTMITLKSNDHYNTHVEGDPIALITGGTGISNDSTIQALSCVYILSRCVSTDNSDVCHHLLWERLSCMHVPRFNHTAFRWRGYVIVCGGSTQSSDTFDEEMASCCEVITGGNSNKLAVSKQMAIPSLIGCASIGLDSTAQQSSESFLVAGGIHTNGQAFNDDKFGPLQIFQCIENDKAIDIVRSKINFVKVEGCHPEDLGVCVHHCLVQLPSEKQQQHGTSYVSSCVLVGGGVPSFSFGQSYAR